MFGNTPGAAGGSIGCSGYDPVAVVVVTVGGPSGGISEELDESDDCIIGGGGGGGWGVIKGGMGGKGGGAAAPVVLAGGGPYAGCGGYAYMPPSDGVGVAVEEGCGCLASEFLPWRMFGALL